MVNVLDASLREIGLATDFAFGVDDGLELARGLAVVGVDFVEIGYVRPAAWDGPPSWSSCSPQVMRAARAALGSTQMSVFVHPRQLGYEHLAVLREEGVDLVRVGIGPLSEAADVRILARDLLRCGLRFTVNLTRGSKRSVEEVLAGAHLAGEVGASVIYLADSNGSMLPSRVRELVDAMRAGTELDVGFHGHDNLSLAFANSLTALEGGATWVDGCIGGAGKGGGNLSTERIALYLLGCGRRVFDVVGLTTVSQDWLSRRSLDAPGFWEAVNGMLDLDLDECLVADALPTAERSSYYEATHGLPLTPRVTSWSGRVPTDSLSTFAVTAPKGQL